MTSLASRERALLCATALQAGADAPTLCGRWTVKELVVHLLVREGSPAAVGIMVPALSGVLDRAMERRGREDLDSLVRALRNGPPLLSPFSVPKLGDAANLIEFYIHHEDVRRAQPGWEPRELAPADQDALWRTLGLAGRAAVRSSPLGVVVRRSDTGATTRLKGGDRSVTVSGLPSEVALFVYGRKDQARVELEGDPADVLAVRDAGLGI